MCFGDELETETEYISRIVGYLHRDLEEASSRSSRSSRSSGPKTKLQKKAHKVTVRDVTFQKKEVDDIIHAMQNRWEMFALLNGPSNEVHASCLVHFNDIYQVCEIHEVCVATPGKGYCKQLIQNVKDHIAAGKSGIVHTINIFCENGNAPACRCYSSIFQGAHKTRTGNTTGFIYRLQQA